MDDKDNRVRDFVNPYDPYCPYNPYNPYKSALSLKNLEKILSFSKSDTHCW